MSMANMPENRHPIEKLVDDVEFKQRNTTWPDAMVNASKVDELLWKGSSRITKIQRVGVAVLGLAFVLVGVVILGSIDTAQEGWWIGIPFVAGIMLVACKLLWNSMRQNDPPKATKKR